MRLLLATLFSLLTLSSQAADLVMVEQDGCHWCMRWNEEISHIYPKTPEGQFAPLIRRDLSAPEPEGVTFARKVVFTPTFVLIEDGRELARIEGYPGEDFFWSLLGMMLQSQTDFALPES